MARQRRLLSIERFAEAQRATEDTDDAIVQAGFAAETRVVEADRTLQFTLSNGGVDRHGDTVSADGWKLDNFRANPVVLWAHDYQSLPVARAPRVWIEDGQLKALAEFTPAGMARFNDTVFEMYRAGFLSAVSVGFQPVKWAWVDDKERPLGIEFQEQELLEFSCVPVPALPTALIDAAAKGIDCTPLTEWAERLLGIGAGHTLMPDDDLTVLRGELQDLRARAAADPANTRPRLLRAALDLARLRPA